MDQTAINRRKFLKQSSIFAAVAALGQMPGLALETSPPDTAGFLRHRFGVNYVPSRNWYYCYNDWDASAIAKDFDRIADIGADHLRVMVVWPWFQPNPTYISTAHLDRLDQLMQLAAERKLDVLPTIYTGWLSGFHFNPPYLENEPFYISPKWAKVQEFYLEQISRRMQTHQNFLGFDIGNEINCNWHCATQEGDAWMENIFSRMRKLCPNGIYVNGVDQQPWFSNNTFSPEALVAQQPIVVCIAGLTGRAQTNMASRWMRLMSNYRPAWPLWRVHLGKTRPSQCGLRNLAPVRWKCPRPTCPDGLRDPC